jgi:hypothetical protein
MLTGKARHRSIRQLQDIEHDEGAMSDQRDIKNSDDVLTGLSRREIIKRGLALGAVGYAAPMIIGAVTPVSAQGVSGTGCVTTISNCLDEPSPDILCGDDDLPCVCLTSVAGPLACVFVGGVVGCPEDACDTDADCDPGSVCLTVEDIPDCNGCANQTFCLPLCSGTVIVAGQQNRSSWPAFSSLR